MNETVRPRKRILIRDLLIFHAKLWLDGLKDVVLAPISVFAVILDILIGPGQRGLRLYRVLRLGERFDLWLNLYGAARVAERSRDGLFAGSEPGDGTMLGALEELRARPGLPPPQGREGERRPSPSRP